MNKWIKYKEIPPPVNIRFIAFIQYPLQSDIFIGEIMEKGFGDDDLVFYAECGAGHELCFDINLITHWMFLPGMPQ